MSKRADQVLQSQPPDKQAEIKQALAGINFDDLFKNLDLGALGKKVMLALIDFAQAQILPQVTKVNALLGYALAAALDALEGSLK